MTDPIEVLLKDYKNRGVKKSFFIMNESFGLSPENYSTIVFESKTKDPEGIMFNSNFTDYGILLSVEYRGQNLDSAVLGFNINDSVSDCLQIQGGKGRFKELTPLMWDKVLLTNLIDFSKELGLDAVSVIPIYLVEGLDEKNADRLKKRYDDNALSHGFKFSSKMGRYILDL